MKFVHRVTTQDQQIPNINKAKHIPSNTHPKIQQTKSELGNHPVLPIDDQGLTIQMNLEYVLGTNINSSLSANIYAFSNDELIYYIDNMIIKYNLNSRDYRIFYVDTTVVDSNSQEDCHLSHEEEQTQIINKIKSDSNKNIQKNPHNKFLLTKYFPNGTNSLLSILKKINGYYYLCLFWIDSNTPPTEFKISNSPNQIYTNFTFHHKKGYLYLLYIHNVVEGDLDTNHGKYQYVKVMEIKRVVSEKCFSSSSGDGGNKNDEKKVGIVVKHKVLLDCCVKKTGGGVHNIDDLVIGDDHSELYLFGADYFRQWHLCFTERSMKQSNYRNIERNIKKQKILNIFWTKEHFLTSKNTNHLKNTKTCSPQIPKNNKQSPFQKKKNQYYLIVLTQIQMLFIYNNELIHKITIPIQSPICRTQKQTTQLILQRSLNQIYKTKFRVERSQPSDDDDNNEQKQPNEKMIPHKSIIKLTSASNTWVQLENEGPGCQKQRKVVKFCAALDSNRIFIYKIQPDFSIKIQGCLKNDDPIEQFNNVDNVIQLPSLITQISASPDGSLLLLTTTKNQNYIRSRTQNFDDTDLHPFYGIGHGHTSQIISISCPKMKRQVITVGKNQMVKIWNCDQKERGLIIDGRFKVRALEGIMHPSGFMVIVNFGTQIKIFGIVLNQLQEISSTKTDGLCSHIQFNGVTNFLISNQRSTIKIYDPTTLLVLGKIESVDLRVQFTKMKVSQNGQYIIYQNTNYELYRKTINSILTPQQSFNQKYSEYLDFYNDDQQEKQKQINHTFCHLQSQIYTCFYFDFGSAVKQPTPTQSKKVPLSSNNIFIGFTLTKFMTVYSNYGQNLITEFPVCDGIYVTECCLTEYMVFLGTSNGKILAYCWPILQSSFQLEILDEEKSGFGVKKALYKLKKPIHEFVVWKNYAPISSLLKIPNHCQLVVGGVNGLIGFVRYSFNKNGVVIYDNEGALALTNQRKKLVEAMNNIRFMRVADIDKILKLIQKTQHDIQKLDYQIITQKNRKNSLLDDEQKKLQKNIEKRKNAYIEERNQKFVQQEKQMRFQENQYQQKINQKERIRNQLEEQFGDKVGIERNQILVIKNQIQEEKAIYRQKIQSLINGHKQKIKQLKETNIKNIRKLQDEFETLAKQKFCEHKQIGEIKSVNTEKEEQINSQLLKVEQLQEYIANKELELSQISTKQKQAKKMDEVTQLLFDENLQKYNECRYENLMLHAQLIKMQNQLCQRKQILNKKGQLIQQVSKQKQINETYKQFINGSISNLQTQKQNAYQQYIKKQQFLRMLFDQLTLQITKSQTKTLKKQQLTHTIQLYQSSTTQKQQNISLTIQKLTTLKNYLLVQGINFNSEQKKIYKEQQKLLKTIRWFQKRFTINCINENKNIGLKQTGVNQIINQNKNLLEECNQLREEGIMYQNQIEHLSDKLNEINTFIGFQKKLKNQNIVIKRQSIQLNQIRNLIQNQLDRASQEIQQQI